MIGLKRGTVALLNHEHSWDRLAAEMVRCLKGIFGKGAVDVQHVGSTAIKTIKAKPIIDIAVAVKDLEYARKYIPLMERNGYMHKAVHEGELFFSCGDFENDIRTGHIHVVEAKGSRWADYILFRDYMNENINIAKEYEALKIQLCEKYSNDREACTIFSVFFIYFVFKKSQDAPREKSIEQS